MRIRWFVALMLFVFVSGCSYSQDGWSIMLPEAGAIMTEGTNSGGFGKGPANKQNCWGLINKETGDAVTAGLISTDGSGDWDRSFTVPDVDVQQEFTMYIGEWSADYSGTPTGKNADVREFDVRNSMSGSGS